MHKTAAPWEELLGEVRGGRIYLYAAGEGIRRFGAERGTARAEGEVGQRVPERETAQGGEQGLPAADDAGADAGARSGRPRRRKKGEACTKELKELAGILQTLAGLEKELGGGTAVQTVQVLMGEEGTGAERVSTERRETRGERTWRIYTSGRRTQSRTNFCGAKKKYVAFGGARGGGEKLGGAVQGQLLAQRYPGIRMLLVRRTMPEIEANHLETLRLELAGTAVYRAEETVRVRERERIAVRVLRLRPGRGSLSGRGVRRDLFRRGHAAEGAVDAEAGGVRARRERISKAHLHVQPGRAGAWVYQAAVYRPAV